MDSNERSERTSPWMRVEEAARYVAVPLGQLQKWAAAGLVPRHRLGKHFVYHRDELDAWVRNGGTRHGL
jgi:excisionase family DNA binding protein